MFPRFMCVSYLSVVVGVVVVVVSAAESREDDWTFVFEPGDITLEHFISFSAILILFFI